MGETPARTSSAKGNQILKVTAREALGALSSSVEFGLTEVEARRRLEEGGPNEVPEEHPRWLLLLAKKFWGLSAWMIELIIVLSWLLGRNAELAISGTLLCVNALIGFFQDRRATKAVAALRSRLSVNARVLRDASWNTVPACELVPGDIVRLRSGDFVPADAKVINGDLGVDQSSMTGESMEVSKATDDVIYSGSIVRRGEATALVALTGTRTYYGRTTELVQGARPKLHLEEVVAKIVRWLFTIVGVLVAGATAVALVRGIPIAEILTLSLVLLLGAIPVALPVMFTVSMAVGSMELAKRGVLVTRLSAAEDAAAMDLLCIDKTGTITLNQLAVTGTLPLSGFTDRDVLRYGALASQAANQDPIDLALLSAGAALASDGNPPRLVSFTPFSPATRRTEAMVDVGGRRFRVLKGALRAVTEICEVPESEVATLEERAMAEARKGGRVLAVAAAIRNERPEVVGLVTLADPPRPESPELIAELRRLGVGVKMLTGDALPIAEEVARAVGLGQMQRADELRAAVADRRRDAAVLAETTDGFAEVYPEDKFLVVRALQEARHVTGMTGDGVNDAPALRQAEVGIAVKGAADVAKAAASVVLTSEGLTSIVSLVRNGRVIHERILTWIVNKISRTILKTGLVTGAFLLSGKFVISAFGMMALIFMTDFVKITLATDRAQETPKPASWNIGGWVKVGVALGVLLAIEAGALLALGWHVLKLGRDPEALSTFTFLMLLQFALCSLVSIRERRAFWKSRPSTLLATVLILDGLAGLLLSTLGAPGFRPLPLTAVMTVLGYSFLVTLLLNDFAKRMFIRWFVARA